MLNERDEQSPNTKGVSIGDVLRLCGTKFSCLVRDKWAREELKQGDLIVAVEQTGDGLFDYLLLDQTSMLGRLALSTSNPTFEAYAMGTLVTNVTGGDVAALMEGGAIDIDAPEEMAEPTTKAFSMRDLPATTRMVLATLVLRHRSAKAQVRRLQEIFGDDNIAVLNARSAEIESWNSLQSALRSVMDEVAGKRVSVGDAHAFLRHAVLAAASRKRADARNRETAA
jgi:hypothetical protein